MFWAGKHTGKHLHSTKVAQESVNFGGDLPVVYNAMHDANFSSQGVEAYVTLPGSHAACTETLSNFDSNRFLSWQHSISRRIQST